MILCHLFWGFGFTTTTTNCHEFVPKIDFVQKVNKKKISSQKCWKSFQILQRFCALSVESKSNIETNIKVKHERCQNVQSFWTKRTRTQSHSCWIIRSMLLLRPRQRKERNRNPLNEKAMNRKSQFVALLVLGWSIADCGCLVISHKSYGHLSPYFLLPPVTWFLLQYVLIEGVSLYLISYCNILWHVLSKH